MRRSAEERREEIVEVALRHFAEGGYHGTSTEAIAREAGISQPYLFRLFRTKRDLFVACCERCYARVGAVFAEAAAAAAPEDRLEAMGKAYVERLVTDREVLLFQLQSYAASGEPAIQAAVHDGFNRLVRETAELAGVPETEMWPFFASGMLINVVAAAGLEDAPWALPWTKAG
jgi:AcrR family transcriptional regulator